MRTIKYRGKLGTDWWYVTPDDAAWAHFWELVDRTTVGQYTGLCDKQGHDIYEGDSVQYEAIGVRGHVAWVENGPGFLILNPEKTTAFVIHEQWEIIGTIYDPVLEEHVS